MEDKTDHKTKHRSIFKAGTNCWRLEQTNRLGILIDASDYFSALRSACLQAEQSVFILGWDFDRLEKIGRNEGDPSFEEFFNQLLEQNDSLHIYLLLWDFNMIYAAEREWFQAWRLRVNSDNRLHVHFDESHPAGGSQHQKIVVIDDALAFCGGIDLSRWRWDTSEHKAQDQRRIDPDGKPYPPFHDIMLAVDGKAAEALAEVARTRWKFSGSSDKPVATEEPRNDVWPEDLNAKFEQQLVAIARTFPAYEGREKISEVEQLFVDSIADAKDYIYVENQYFTSDVITQAMADRLASEEPPDILLVLPQHTGGWLEQATMDKLRDAQIKQLHAADHRSKLRVYYPSQPGLAEDECISVHAKLMIIDDRFIHAGSANTSDRSMGTDSECDLAWEAPDNPAVSWLLHRLLAEHLGSSIEEVETARSRKESLGDAVESLRLPGKRTLEKLKDSESAVQTDVLAEAGLADPKEPISGAYFANRAIPDKQAPRGRRHLLLFLGFIALLLLMAAAWRWTPAADWITPEQLAQRLEWFNQPWLRFLAVFLLLLIASLLMVPLTLLVVVCALLLGPWTGLACAMAGALTSAWVGFIVGKITGGKLLRQMDGSQIHKLSEKLSDRGIMAVAMLRLLPVAPYTVVNMAAGASHLKQGPFMIGSAIGLAPGIGALTLFSETLYQAVMNPSAMSLTIVALVAIIIIVAAFLLRRLLKVS